MKIVFYEKDERLKKLFDKEWKKVDVSHYGKATGSWEPKHFVFEAVEGKEVLGYVKGLVLHGVGKVEELIVKEKHRRKGVGYALMQKAHEYIKKHGGWKVILVTGQNWPERQFYRKLGYKAVAYLKNHYLGRDFVMLEKRL